MPVYGVTGGGIPGIYEDWTAASAACSGHKGARVKKFNSTEEAARFVESSSGAAPPTSGGDTNATRPQLQKRSSSHLDPPPQPKHRAGVGSDDANFDDKLIASLKDSIHQMQALAETCSERLQQYRGTLFDAGITGRPDNGTYEGAQPLEPSREEANQQSNQNMATEGGELLNGVKGSGEQVDPQSSAA